MTTLLLLTALVLAVCFSARSQRNRILTTLQASSESKKGAPTSASGLEDPALMLELVAVMFRAGSTLPIALEYLASVVHPELKPALKAVSSGLTLGAEWRSVWKEGDRTGCPPAFSALEESLRFVAQTGVPASQLIEAEAARIRRERCRELQSKAAALGVQLVLPLGLCALPAFIFWAVVPVVIAVMPMP